MEERADAGEFEREVDQRPRHGGHCLHEADWGALHEWQKAVRVWQDDASKKLDTVIALVTATNGRLRRIEEWWAFGKGALAVVIVLELLPKLIDILHHPKPPVIP